MCLLTPFFFFFSLFSFPSRLKVKVDGTPQPTITWFKDGNQIQTSEIYEIETVEEDGTSELTVPSSTPEDAGEYTVEALNEYGVAHSTIVLSKLRIRCYFNLPLSNGSRGWFIVFSLNWTNLNFADAELLIVSSTWNSYFNLGLGYFLFRCFCSLPRVFCL